MYSCRRIQNGVWGGAPTGGWGDRAPPLQSLLTNGLNPYSGFTFQVHLLRSLHVYAISEVNAYTPILVKLKFKVKNYTETLGGRGI